MYSDTLKPHELPFTGMLDRHPRSASGRGGCFISRLSCLGLLFVVPVWVSVVVADGDGRQVAVTDVQGPAVRVVGDDDAADAELVDQGRCIGGAGHLAGTAVPRSQVR